MYHKNGERRPARATQEVRERAAMGAAHEGKGPGVATGARILTETCPQSRLDSQNGESQWSRGS